MSLVSETVALYFRVRAASEDIHAHSSLSGAMRGVLRDLDSSGPLTVPQLARRRPVTRQHIQAIVNDLQRHGLVELVDNPKHKRSHLVQLTPAGRQTLQEIVERERSVLERVELQVSEEDLQTATEVLTRLRRTMEQDEWRSTIRQMFYEDGDVPPNPWIDDTDDEPEPDEPVAPLHRN